jgi:predicted DNA-binding protein YlxM (UPF0122 family)
MRLFLNPEQHAYLRELADEFGASPSQIHDELQHLKNAEILESHKNGRQINYSANTKHPLFSELHSMVKKSLGMDRILDSIIERLGDLEEAYLLDDYAKGKDSGLIDLLLVGEIDQDNLTDLVSKTERYIGRKIRTLVMTRAEYVQSKSLFVNRPQLLLWNKGISELN